jgi:hypothetical protein
MTNYPGDNDAMAVWTGKNRVFDDPFLLPSSNSIPTELQSALDFCLYLYYLNPLYRRASIRVISHFVTDIDFVDKSGDQKERDEFKDYLIHKLDLFGALLEMGQEWSCFQGDTKVVTQDGSVAIKTLTGKRVNVLSRDGVYRPADFKSYGMQPLMEVTFSDGRKVYATPEHKWYVKNRSGKEVTRTTAQLKNKYRIKRTVAPRPEKNEEYMEGVRHGFIFGDGTRAGKRTTALFCGKKNEALLPFFVGHGNQYSVRHDRSKVGRISGFPQWYKELPEPDKSASYWYGFVSGFLAADGTVDTYGCAMLTQIKRSTLEAIEAQLPRIGMCAGPIRSQRRLTQPGRSAGNTKIYASTIHLMTLLKRFMHEDDFLIESHITKFNKFKSTSKSYGEYVAIQAVKMTDRIEEVFCCEEMETHSIVVDNGILTSQCYGNGFLRLHFPFDRVLIDHRDGKYKEYALPMFGNDVKYDYKSMKYDVPDPLTFHKPKDQRTRVKLDFIDRPSRDKDRIKLRKIDPRQIVLQHAFLSGKTQVLYRFEPEFVTLIRNSVMFQVNETPMSMLKAIAMEQDFLFNEGQVFHFRAPTISGVSNFGWGMPETIANYRHIHQLQVLRKIDEVVGLDYMLPFRLFSPVSNTQANDPMNYMLLSRWGNEIKEIIKRRRADPFAMHALPFPVSYQEFGAQGKSLAPKELVEYHNNTLLDAMGYPAELFKGSLQVQQVPTAVRLFENSFHFIHQNFDRILKWVTKRILDYIGQAQMGVSLQLPRIADNLEKQNVYMQLAAGAEIPRSIAYAPFGITDPIEAAKQRAQEDIAIKKEQNKLQADFEREQSVGSMDSLMAAQAQQNGGGGGNGSSPAGPANAGGAAGNVSPLDIQQQAEEMAAKWLQLPIGERRKEMDNVRATNPNLHAMAKQKMEEMRSQAGSAGVQQLSQPPQ